MIAFRRCAMALAGFLVCASIVCGYRVGPAVSIEKMADEADIVFKGTAVSSGLVEDEWFKPVHDFVVRETKFKVVSVIKGEGEGAALRTTFTLMFRHYDEAPEPRGRDYEPQHYRFEAGKTYIVFAKNAGPAGVFRQLWPNHKSKEDQGAVLCADDKPVAAKTAKDAIWAELTTMLKSVRAADVTYAVRQLDQMSGDEGRFGTTQDFDRKDALAAVRGLTAYRDPKVARAAIEAVGSHNPYMSDERTLFWLATVGGGDIPGLSKMDPKFRNVGGELYWKDLVALADAPGPVETRSLAILALGLVREPELRKAIDRWTGDPAPEIRAAATVLLADFPGPETVERLTVLTGDASPDVRASAARAAGFAQATDMAGVMGKLLGDKDVKVRTAAAMSLLSFSPKNEGVARVFRANLANEEFRPLFLIALARENPETHVDALAQAVAEKQEPKNFWGGQTPAFTAWEILFKWLQAQPAEAVRSGKLDRYLDALEKVGSYSSSEPRDIYAFYIQRGMTERAKKFREAAKKAVTYDLDYYFNMVDENPSLYKRE